VTKDWTQHWLSFADIGDQFSLPDGSHPLPALFVFDPDQLTNIQFFFVAWPTDTSDRDIWIDDVAFYR
jgi:hypothetical protein